MRECCNLNVVSPSLRVARVNETRDITRDGTRLWKVASKRLRRRALVRLIALALDSQPTMGVPELWEVSGILTCIDILSSQRRACIARQILNHAGKSRAIAHLAVVDGFEKNDSGCRAFRVGVDASIWLQHATFSAGRPEDREKRGHNPELRLLFNRLCKLSRLPLSLLFMFDGKERPKVKRGSRMGKSGSHNLAKGFKKLLDIFGVDWREVRLHLPAFGHNGPTVRFSGEGRGGGRARVSQPDWLARCHHF